MLGEREARKLVQQFDGDIRAVLMDAQLRFQGLGEHMLCCSSSSSSSSSFAHKVLYEQEPCWLLYRLHPDVPRKVNRITPAPSLVYSASTASHVYVHAVTVGLTLENVATIPGESSWSPACLSFWDR